LNTLALEIGSLNDCAIDESAMLQGIERGSMKALASWVKESDHVMVFQGDMNAAGNTGSGS
jgi:hypothetical protein